MKRNLNFGHQFVPDMSHLSTICVVMEYIDTDLDQIFKHKIDFGENHMIKICYSTLCSIAFCHEANIMHRDLKSANILLSSDCNTKICDFGLSRSMAQGCTTQSALNTINVRNQADSILKQADESLTYEDTSTNKMWNDNRKKERLISELLIKDRPRRYNQVRYMSIHVGSRWYRAPEVGLVEK